jgi:hypothetical protein
VNPNSESARRRQSKLQATRNALVNINVDHAVPTHIHQLLDHINNKLYHQQA